MEVNNETIKEIYELGKSYFLTFKREEVSSYERIYKCEDEELFSYDFIFICWGLCVLGIYDNYVVCIKENQSLYDTTKYVKVASFGDCFVWRDKKYIK